MRAPALVPEFYYGDKDGDRVLWVVRSMSDGLVICNDFEGACEFLKEQAEAFMRLGGVICCKECGRPDEDVQ